MHFEAVRRLGPELADAEGAADQREQAIRENSDNRNRDVVGQRGPKGGDPRLLQPDARFRGIGALVDRQQAVRAFVPHLGAGRLIGLDNAEGAEKPVQLGRVIEVARVLVEQLPVGADRVALVAGQHHRPCEHRGQALADGRSQIVFQRRRVVGEGAEDHAGPTRDPERLHPVPRSVEGSIVAAGSAAALFPGHASDPPGAVVAPVVVDAGEAAGVAARPAHPLRRRDGRSG